MPEESVSTELNVWLAAMDSALHQGDAIRAGKLAQVVLRRLPRHLPTYHRLLRAAWRLKRWVEAEDWGRRLLQADPGHGEAWQAVARAAEHRGARGEACAMWQRAFEVDPYAPETRAGLSRTSLEPASALLLNQACLASLYRRTYRWAHAATIYRSLVQADPRRIDFQVSLMVALWRQDAQADAYRLARHLVQHHPHLLMAWMVLRATGDENDRALARNPIATMDPDGTFAREWLRLLQAPISERAAAAALPVGPMVLHIHPDEAAVLRSPASRT